MGSPKIKDRLFHSQRTGCFFIAETTQNELIVKPSSFVLPQIAPQLLQSCMCMCMCKLVSLLPGITSSVHVLGIVRRGKAGLMFSRAKIQKGALRNSTSYIHLFI